MLGFNDFIINIKFSHLVTGLLCAIIILCMNFEQYLPITADDFSGIYVDGKYEGITQNRLWWIFTAPIGQFVMRSLFSLRWVYGVHVLFYFIPVVVLFIYLWNIYLKREAILGLAILLSIKILGYEHSAPLCYPVMHSLMLGLSMLSGFSVGIMTSYNRLLSNHKFLSVMILGCLSALWYEYYPLIFFICAIWSNIEKTNTIKFGILLNPVKLLIYITPLITIIVFKLFGLIFFRNNPKFATYSGTNLSLSDISIDYMFESVAIAFQHLLGASIIQHTKKALTWPPMIYDLQFGPTVIIFALLTATSVFFILLMPTNNYNYTNLKIINSSETDNSHISFSRYNIALLATALLTYIQLILHSLSPKYRIWTEAAGFWSGITFLNGSLAIICACFFISILTIKLFDKYVVQFNHKICIAAFISCFTLVLSSYTMTHNLIVSKLIDERANIYQNIISSCDLYFEKNMVSFSNPPNYIYPFTLPIPIHPNSFEGNWSQTMCRIYQNNPPLFKNWKNKNLSYDQKTLIINCGSLPSTNSDLTQCMARDQHP